MALLRRNSPTRPFAERTFPEGRHPTPYPNSWNPITLGKNIHKHGPRFPPTKLVQTHGLRLCGSPSVRGPGCVATTRPLTYHGTHPGCWENSCRIPVVSPPVTSTFLLSRIVVNQHRQPPAIITLLPLDDFRLFVRGCTGLQFPDLLRCARVEVASMTLS